MITGRPFAPRSLLFVPGSRPDMVAKVPRWRPDATVVDLEDAVRPGEKDRARRVGLAAASDLDPAATITLARINSLGSRWFTDDLQAAANSRIQGLVLPKYESADALASMRAQLPGTFLIVVGLETARGVASSRELLVHGPDAVYFGAEDYIADVGGYRTGDGYEVLHARSEVILAARLAGISAVDQAVVDISHDPAFLADAQAGKSIGYAGKICIHPRQVELAHRVFTPSPEEVNHARRVVEAATAGGVAVVDGHMVDEVHVRMARQILARSHPEDER